MIIKEKVKPVDSLADRVRSLHGHVTIDLHNHNSGFTERIEKDNLVTNALSMVLPLACDANALNEFFPIATQALGGIMLFSESLTEEAANVWFPGGSNKLVGFAGQNADETNPMSGELNALESGPITGGYTTVWDFSTAQANGTISALARTHKNIGTNRTHGRAAFPNAEAADNVGLMRQMLYYDPHGTLYGLNRDSSDPNLYTETVYFDRPGVAYAYPKVSGDLTDTGIEIPSGNTCWVNGYDGYIYNYDINATDKVITWRRMYAADESFDLTSLVTQSYADSSPIQGASNYNFCVANGCCYCLSPNGQTIYKYSLLQAADVTTIPIGDVIRQLTANAAGAVCACSDTHCYRINANNNVVAIAGQNYYPGVTGNLSRFTGLQSADSIRFVYGQEGGGSRDRIYLFATNDYLGTIANISPVTKTASQSMKITYTLTDV